MKIIIDFESKRAMGNVYDTEVPDNLADFEKAKKMYEQNKVRMDKAIIEAINMDAVPTIGSSIEIPTIDYADRGFIKRLFIDISSVDDDKITCVLTKVGH